MPPIHFRGERLEGHVAARICPMCKVGMFASKVNDGGQTYQVHHCPRCGCIITAGERDDARDRGAEPMPKQQMAKQQSK